MNLCGSDEGVGGRDDSEAANSGMTEWGRTCLLKADTDILELKRMFLERDTANFPLEVRKVLEIPEPNPPKSPVAIANTRKKASAAFPKHLQNPQAFVQFVCERWLFRTEEWWGDILE